MRLDASSFGYWIIEKKGNCGDVVKSYNEYAEKQAKRRCYFHFLSFLYTLTAGKDRHSGKNVADLLPATGEVGTAKTDRAGTRFPPAQRGFRGI